MYNQKDHEWDYCHVYTRSWIDVYTSVINRTNERVIPNGQTLNSRNKLNKFDAFVVQCLTWKKIKFFLLYPHND
jgi:hypothetical protein